jgi:hypothetical protein
MLPFRLFFTKRNTITYSRLRYAESVSSRRLTGLLCLAVVLGVVLITALNLDVAPSLAAFLVPDLFLFAILLVAIIRRDQEGSLEIAAPALLILPARAPPLS